MSRLLRGKMTSPKFLFCSAVLLLALAFCGHVVFKMARGPQIREHVAAADCPLDLPEGATDVCYYVPAPFGPNTAYEFSCKEKAFVEWMNENGWPVREIAGESVELPRYTAFSRDRRDEEPMWVRSGCVYEWVERDCGVTVAYNRETGRAYFFSHSR